MAATVTDLANGTSTTSTNSISTGATVTAVVGDWLVVIVAADNAGASGVSSLTTVIDSGGVNVYTQRAVINRTAGAAANDGATLGIYTCQVTSAITGGTINAGFSPNTTSKAIEVYKVAPAAGETVKLVNVSTAGATGTATTHSAPQVSVFSGDIIFGAAAIETNTAVTGDADATNGSWSAVVTRLANNAATDLISMTCSSQFKTVTATGNQDWACTTAATKDSARTYLVLQSSNDGLRGYDTTTALNRLPHWNAAKRLTAAVIASCTLGWAPPVPAPSASETTGYAVASWTSIASHAIAGNDPPAEVAPVGLAIDLPWQNPPAKRALTAAVLATTQAVLVERFMPAVGTPSALAYDLPWNGVTRLPQRSPKLLGDIATAPPQPPPLFPPIDLPWQAQLAAAKRSTKLLEGWNWPGYGYSFVAVQTPTDLWFQPWQNPVSLSPRRAVNLLQDWPWPGAGYSFFQPVPPPTEWWYERWQNPPHILSRKRSVKLLGNDFIQGPRRPEVEYVNGWFAQWEDPPAYDVDVEFIPIFDENGDAILDESGNPILAEPFAYQIPRRCIALKVGWNWLPRVADREFQDGWRSSFSVPRQFSSPKRATNLSESWPWPGYGYFFQAIVPPPTEWWYERWQNPPQLLSPRPRSPELYGDVKPDGPRVPDREFQEGWRSSFTVPARLYQPPRQQGFTTFPGVAGLVVTYQEGWRSAFSQPQKVWQPPRQQGFVSFAGVSGLPVTLSPGSWSPQPAAYWAQRRNWRLAASWQWQAYSFTIPAPTPTALWHPVWQEQPRERLRSVALRQSAWAAWDPQFIIQVTPPTPLEGVTFTFGLKRGASATPGTKEGATMTGQRKTGGATLLTRVKPRNS